MLVDYLVLVLGSTKPLPTESRSYGGFVEPMPVRPSEILIDPMRRPKGNNDVLRHFLFVEEDSMVNTAWVSMHLMAAFSAVSAPSVSWNTDMSRRPAPINCTERFHARRCQHPGPAALEQRRSCPPLPSTFQVPIFLRLSQARDTR